MKATKRLAALFPAMAIMGRRRHAISLLLLLTYMLALPACGESQRAPEQEGVLIYAALNPISEETQRTIKRFNKNHTDVQIEVRDYTDEGGLERLSIELALGQVPDIMELHCYGMAEHRVKDCGQFKFIPGNYAAPAGEYWMPYRQLAQRGYLEDLWPYIENDPDLGREGVLQAPLKAAEVNNGLYMLFSCVCISTLMGRESVVGARYSWTLEDVMDVYANMPDDSTILRYNMTKANAFFSLLSNTLERYVDRATGECSFDSEDFHDLVRFLEVLPDEVDAERTQAAEEEIIRRIKYGRQMLESTFIIWPRNIAYSDSFFQERAAFPGYPTEDGSSGNFFYAMKNKLAMSSACWNKDAAWDFLREQITPRSSKGDPLNSRGCIPINLHDYELLLWGELKTAKELASRFPKNPEMYLPGVRYFTFGPEVRVMHLVTEEDNQRFQELVEHTTQLYWPEDDLANIVWETLGPYFAGDKTLEQTIDLLNNRVGLYLHEQM